METLLAHANSLHIPSFSLPSRSSQKSISTLRLPPRTSVHPNYPFSAPFLQHDHSVRQTCQAAVITTPETSDSSPPGGTEENEGVLPHALVLKQGPREEMEDEADVRKAGKSGYMYAAVYDGHAGASASEWLKKELYEACVKAIDSGAALNSSESAASVLTEAFLATDTKLLDWLLEAQGAEREAGSTATVLLVKEKEAVIVANVGDSRAVLSRGGNATDLCGDHRPYGSSKTAAREMKRIREAGGWVINGRVCGMLAVSRAFGDIMYKRGRKEMLEEGLKRKRWTQRFVDRLRLEDEWVTAAPDVSYTRLLPEDEFLILATDGLWDVVKSATAVKFVAKQLKEHGDLQKAADELMMYAIRDRVGQDNTSIIIIDLREKGKDPKT